ncbi:blue light receptor [Coelomomyces lativittatus]|nr:blue light receptor [Coelomomyces lativittatus]
MGVSDMSEAQKSFYRALMLQMDLVHSLSLRGVFLYVSPGFCKVLEYNESEMTGHHISEFCHPGDLVCLLRELKESSNCSKPVHLLFRARKKNSGYTWLEVSGQCAQGEKNRGKKFIVLSGREKKIVKLHRKDFLRTGGHTNRDFWSKLGLEGIYLHTCADFKQILDYAPSDLVGKSLVDLTHPSDREKVLSALRMLSENNVVTLTHSIKNKSNVYVKVCSSFFPCNSSCVDRVAFCLHKCTDVFENKKEDIEFFPCSKIENVEDDLFSTFSINNSTSWQYDLHQLRLENQRLREELDDIESERGKKKSKQNFKKRLQPGQ